MKALKFVFYINLLFVIFLICGSIFIGTSKNIYETFSMDWIKTVGVIKNSYFEVSERTKGTSYCLRITYEYSVGKSKLLSSQIYREDFCHISKLSAKKAVESYPEGSVVDVFYSKRNPTEAVLKKGIVWPSYLLPIVSFIGIAIPLLFFYLGIARWRRVLSWLNHSNSQQTSQDFTGFTSINGDDIVQPNHSTSNQSPLGKPMLYVPNRVPLTERAWNTVCSLTLLIYGGYGIYINDLYLPGRRGNGTHLHDEPAFIMYAAFVCGALVLLSIVVDHYDERDNEHKYQLFAKVFKYLGWGLFGISLILYITK